MKPMVTILSVMSLCFASSALAKVVIQEGHGTCSACYYTVFFPQASDTPKLNLNEKIVTPSGDVVERIDDPRRGLLVKDPAGLMWTSTLMKDSPYMEDYQPGGRLVPEKIYPRYASDVCKSIGARLPTLTEYRNLAKLFINKQNQYDSKSAAKILDPAMPVYTKKFMVSQKYLTNLNHYNPPEEYMSGSYNSNIFALYGDDDLSENQYGLPYDYHDVINEEARMKCVVTADMLVPTDYKKKYDSLEMPVMSSCDPAQFDGSWKVSEVACYNPQDVFAPSTTPEIMGFKFNSCKAKGSLYDVPNHHIPEQDPREFTAIWGYHGGAVKPAFYSKDWYNAQIDTNGSNGETFYGQSIKSRKDKKGCDVYGVGISSYQMWGNGNKTLKPTYLFTIGRNKKDGSIILKSESTSLRNVFCFEGARNKDIHQALKLESVK